jgi:hypothetical protein
MPTNVMVIYEQFDRDPIISLVAATPKELKLLKIAHGHYTNGADTTDEQNKALDYVASALAKPTDPSYYEEADLKKIHGIWYKHRVDLKNPVSLEGHAFAFLFVCGCFP